MICHGACKLAPSVSSISHTEAVVMYTGFPVGDISAVNMDDGGGRVGVHFDHSCIDSCFVRGAPTGPLQ